MKNPWAGVIAASGFASLAVLGALIGNAATSPSTAPGATEASKNTASYRIFVEGIQFAGDDSIFKSAQFTYRPEITEGPPTGAGQNLMIGAEWRAKELPIHSKKLVQYGSSYYFPIQTNQTPQGEITIVASGGGFIPTKHFEETFRFKITPELGKTTEIRGDGGSKLTIRLMSACDFNIYDTLDLSGIKDSLKADLEKRGVRVFEETTAKDLFSRPTNAIWIGDKVSPECANIAVDVFANKYGIPIKGVYTLWDDHHSKWYFNPYSVTLGHAKELVGKPDLPKTYFTELMQKNTRRG